VRGQRPEQSGPDPGHPIQPFQAAERPPGIPISNNDLCQREADPGQPSQFGGGRNVGVNLLTGCERPCLVHGTVTLRRRGPVGERGEKLNLTRRLPRAGGEKAHALTCHGQRQQQEQRTTLGREHGRTVRP
jgi:hypothetical protein